jgi:hypothetical protein
MGRIARGLLPLLRPLVRPEACPALRDLLRSLRARELAPEVFWSAWAELPGLAPEAHRELRPIVARYLATRDQPAVPQVNSLQREDPSRLMARAMLEALIECLDRLAQSSEVIPAADPDGRGTEAAPVRSER